MSESGVNPPGPREGPPENIVNDPVDAGEKDLVKFPNVPDEKAFDPQQAAHDARVSLANRIYWLLVGVILLIGLLVSASLFVAPNLNDPDGTSPREAANFLATSLLPAVIGIFGSVVGFYFGKETRDPPS
ncbi:hypothetical protein [Leisingera caerulea]|uniref:hypothetical protein n=1 Tax=Leisingera caerulea TaxID=506591 RepID=UPI0012B53BC1|nr:hypothetical protein [Leisingera caerulea]